MPPKKATKKASDKASAKNAARSGQAASSSRAPPVEDDSPIDEIDDDELIDGDDDAMDVDEEGAGSSNADEDDDEDENKFRFRETNVETGVADDVFDEFEDHYDDVAGLVEGAQVAAEAAGEAAAFDSNIGQMMEEGVLLAQQALEGIDLEAIRAKKEAQKAKEEEEPDISEGLNRRKIYFFEYVNQHGITWNQQGKYWRKKTDGPSCQSAKERCENKDPEWIYVKEDPETYKARLETEAQEAAVQRRAAAGLQQAPKANIVNRGYDMGQKFAGKTDSSKTPLPKDEEPWFSKVPAWQDMVYRMNTMPLKQSISGRLGTKPFFKAFENNRPENRADDRLDIYEKLLFPGKFKESAAVNDWLRGIRGSTPLTGIFDQSYVGKKRKCELRLLEVTALIDANPLEEVGDAEFEKNVVQRGIEKKKLQDFRNTYWRQYRKKNTARFWQECKTRKPKNFEPDLRIESVQEFDDRQVDYEVERAYRARDSMRAIGLTQVSTERGTGEFEAQMHIISGVQMMQEHMNTAMMDSTAGNGTVWDDTPPIEQVGSGTPQLEDMQYDANATPDMEDHHNQTPFGNGAVSQVAAALDGHAPLPAAVASVMESGEITSDSECDELPAEYIPELAARGLGGERIQQIAAGMMGGNVVNNDDEMNETPLSVGQPARSVNQASAGGADVDEEVFDETPNFDETPDFD